MRSAKSWAGTGGNHSSRMQEMKWSQVWDRFAKTTTFHGIAKLSEKSPIRTYRYIWLVIVVASFTAFVYQSSERLRFYLQRPVSVNNQVINNDTLLFPALVICNANSFRLTAAAEQGWYDLLSDLYATKNPQDINLTHYNADHLNLQDVYLRTAHLKEDMIVKCTWGSQKCGWDNFSTTLTDYGVCYTFNGEPTQLAVEQTGAASGLNLLLNVEQYEYMSGPHSSAGLMVLIHSGDGAPSVVNLADAVPVGVHAFIGVERSEVHNQGPPYGTCKEEEDYAVSACMRACRARLTNNLCGCIDLYVTSVSDDPEVCTLGEYTGCLLPKEDTILRGMAECNCSIGCHYARYHTTVTYASTPLIAEVDVPNADESSSLRKKYIQALEVAQRRFPVIADEDERLVVDALERYEELVKSIEHAVDAAARIANATRLYMAFLTPRVWFHYTWGLERVDFTIRNNFMRLWEVIDERTLKHVTTGFYQFTDEFRESMIRSLNSNDSFLRDIVHVSVEDALRTRRKLAQMAQENVTHIQNAFVTGTARILTVASFHRHYDLQWMPSELFYNNYDRNRSFSAWDKYLKIMLSQLDILYEIHEEVRDNYFYDKAKQVKATATYEHRCRSHNYYRYWYFTTEVLPLAETTAAKLKHFKTLNETLLEKAFEVQNSFNEIMVLSSILDTEEGFGIYHQILKFAKEYIVYGNLTKERLSNIINSKRSHASIATFATWLKDLRSRSVHMMDNFAEFSKAYLDIYQDIMQDSFTTNLYRAIHEDIERYFSNNASIELMDKLTNVWSSMLELPPGRVANMTLSQLAYLLNGDIATMNISNVIFIESKTLSDITQDNNLGDMLLDEVELFINALARLQHRCNLYTKSTELDASFHRNNFVYLTVFLKRLAYQEIKQNPAYDITAFLSDIGGTMGLCIGASLISVFEVLDALLTSKGVPAIDKEDQET